MAEGRMLKRVISTSPRLAALKNDTHRLIYTWIIPFLDVEGRMEADPRIIKGYVCPLLDHITTRIISVALQDMAVNELIVLYSVNGNNYLELQRFAKHQTLREGREKKSDIPSPTDGVPTEYRRSTDGQATELSVGTAQQDKIREDKIRERDKLFFEFKKIYPKNVKMKPAEIEWKKKVIPPNIIDLLKTQIKAKEKLKTSGIFTPDWPDPERWIKNERWNDVIETPLGNGNQNPPPRYKTEQETKCPNCHKDVPESHLTEFGCYYCQPPKQESMKKVKELIKGIGDIGNEPG